MALATPLRQDLLRQRITVAAKSGRNFVGDPSYGTGVSYPCRVEGVSNLLLRADGRDVAVRSKVWVSPTSSGGTPNITVQDQVTLPGGVVPKIVHVDTFYDHDSTGLNHQVVYCG